MNPELEALGRRAVACRHWRWMPGMLYNHPKDRSDSALRPRGPNAPIILCGDGGGLPIFSDPSTRGCLLALVREVHGEPTLFVERHAIGPAWQVHSVDGGIFGEGTTEEEALVAALEVAP